LQHRTELHRKTHIACDAQLPCMNALVPSSSPLTIFSKSSSETEIVVSALLPSPSLTLFGLDLPST